MPRIPTYDDNAVGTAARRPQYERPLDVSQGEKEASVALATIAQAADLVDERIAQDDALRAQAAITQEYAKFSAKERINSQGRNADGHAQRVAEWWDKAGAEYSGALSPRAKRLTGASLQRARTTSLADAAVFQEVQLDKSHTEAFTLAQKAQLGRAIEEANNGLLIGGPAGAAQASRIVLNEMRGNAEAFAKVKGKPAEWVADQMLAASTDVHTEVISQLRETDPKAAGEYYKEHKGQIDPRLHDQTEQGLRKASAANDATNEVEQVWSSLGPKTMNDPVDEPKMAAAIREKFANDPERRRLAMAELGQRREMHNRAQAEFTATNTNGALAVFQTTRSVAAVEKSAEYLRLTPGEQLKVSQYMMNYQAQQASLAAARESRDEARIRREIAQQQRTYLPYYNAVSDPTALSAMSRQQVLALQTQIGPELTGNLLQRWDSITKSESKLAEAKIDHDDMQMILRDLKYDPKTKSEDKQAEIGRIKVRMEQVLNIEQAAAKRPLTRDEKIKIMREEASKTVLFKEDWFSFDREVPVAALDRNRLADIRPDQLKLNVSPQDLAALGYPPGAKPNPTEFLTKSLAVLRAQQPKNPNYADTHENRMRLYLRLTSRAGNLVAEE